MSKTRLKYLEQETLEWLKSNIAGNLPRYRNDGFMELCSNKGWSLETNVEVDLSYLEQLRSSGSSSSEDAENSVLVWRAFSNLTPALATEDRVWTRVSHVEGFSYSKERWVGAEKSDDEVAKQVSSHFFASSLTKYRDDHAIGRLWWNAWVAVLLRGSEYESALQLICKTADIRQALMERSLTFSRVSLGRALLRGMERIPEAVSDAGRFRRFMVRVNLAGGGMVFEEMLDTEIDRFVDRCWNESEVKV